MAKDAFDTMLRVGVKPTVYSYTNLINACVRCGELDLAQSYFNQMPSKKVVPNEVKRHKKVPISIKLQEY